VERSTQADATGSSMRWGAYRSFKFLSAAILAFTLVVVVAAAAAPSVSVENASNVRYTTADVKGPVDPEDLSTTWRFQYIAGAQYQENLDGGLPGFEGATTAHEEGIEDEDPQPLERELTGLVPATTDHLRLQAEIGDGQSEAVAVDTFETKAVAVPVVTDVAASAVAYVTATATGKVEVENPDEAFNAYCRFEYVTQAQWEEGGNAFPVEGAPSVSCEPETVTGAEPPEATLVQASLTSLQPGTTYHLRLLASNQGGAGSSEAIDTFKTQEVATPVVLINDADSVTDSAAHFSGTVEVANADDAFSASCRFDYIAQVPYENNGGNFDGAQSIPCDPSLVSGAETQPVSVVAQATGLEPHTLYHLRLAAENTGGTGTATAEHVFTTDAVPPTAVTGTNTFNGVGGTLVRAFVDPRNSQVTDCHFEYGLTSSYGQNVSCAQDVGSGGDPVLVTADLDGLEDEATYHFRVSATTGAGTTLSDDGVFAAPPHGRVPQGCSNEAVRVEQGSEYLSGCRAFELVSPRQKLGSDVIGSSSRTRASVSGDAIAYSSLGGFADVAGTGIGTDYVAKRKNDGWATHAVTPPQEALPLFAGVNGLEGAYEDFSSNLEQGIFRSRSPVPTADDPHPMVEKAQNLYLRQDVLAPGSGAYSLLTDCPSCSVPLPPVTGGSEKPLFAGSNSGAPGAPEYSHFIFESRSGLTADTSRGVPQLYESHGGALSLVGRVPASGDACDDADGPACVASADGSVAGMGAVNTVELPNVISDDGDRTIFSVPRGRCGGYPCGELFQRQDQTRTVKLNASEKATPEEPQGASYWGASADGERVFFTTDEGLVNADDQPGPDLYMYENSAPQGSRLTLLGGEGEAQGVLGTSADGHYVYFLSVGQLVPGADESEGAVKRLYLWRDGEIRYLGDLKAAADSDHNLNPPWNLTPRNVRITADGHRLLLGAVNGSGLVGRDQGEGSCAGGSETLLACRQFYLYDAETNSMQCISCDPIEAPTQIGASINAYKYAGVTLLVRHLNRPLSDDGQRVFFSSGQALTPADSNGVIDVYEYDLNGNEIHLISSGTSSSDSLLLEATPDGNDVYFVTREQLVDSDNDSNFDLYDARMGGGFKEPPITPICSGDSCQGAIAVPPSNPTAGSASFRGPENCKGQRRRQSCRKCVKKRHKRHCGGRNGKKSHSKKRIGSNREGAR